MRIVYYEIMKMNCHYPAGAHAWIFAIEKVSAWHESGKENMTEVRPMG